MVGASSSRTSSGTSWIASALPQVRRRFPQLSGILKSHSHTQSHRSHRIGVRPDTVSAFAGCTARWAAALEPVKPPGRPTRATPEFLAEMRRAALVNRPRWDTVHDMVDRPTGSAPEQGHGHRLRRRPARRLLRRERFSFQRPKHTLKGKRDEAAYEKAKGELIVLKKKR